MTSRWPVAGLVLHGLAHSLPGTQVSTALAWRLGQTDAGVALAGFVTAVLWGGAAVGFVAGAFGLRGIGPYDQKIRLLLRSGAACSLVLLSLWGRPLALVGVALDLTVLAVLNRNPEWGQPRAAGAGGVHARRWSRVPAQAFTAVLAVLIVVRPWHMRWGSTASELRQPLPADPPVAEPTYQIQHAVTIRAPASAIWPWLAQLGGDRAGFYSYSALENLFGLHIRNADRVHPEWQQLRSGDSIFATPAGWLGLPRRLGWRVGLAEPNRALVLDLWGAFVLDSIGPRETRLIVRTRGAQPGHLPDLLTAPAQFFIFEPAHFIMERKMLLGIKRRVEIPPGI